MTHNGIEFCPKCGSGAPQSFCGRCGFEIYAKFENRLIAYIIDCVTLGIFSFAIKNLTQEWPGSHEAFSWFDITFYLFYLLFFVRIWGQTPGKMLMGIKMVRLDGSAVRWSNVWMRYTGEVILTILVFAVELLRLLMRGPAGFVLIPYLAYFIYGICDILVLVKSKERRAIHNYISGTVVINEPKSKPASAYS